MNVVVTMIVGLGLVLSPWLAASARAGAPLDQLKAQYTQIGVGRPVVGGVILKCTSGAFKSMKTMFILTCRVGPAIVSVRLMRVMPG